MFPPELPPVSNIFLYCYRVLAKWFSFFYFGLTSVLLSISILPLMRLFFHPRARFQKYVRRFISASFRFFISLMHFIKVADLIADNKKAFRQLSSKIIVANHPSILDVVMLISLIPNADCIVSGHLQRGILRIIVRQVYIINSDNLENILESCAETLKQGNCLIIFPEGTRTPRSGKVIFKKGAARIAFASNCGIIPVHIGGTDKFGLGKKDPWTGYNPTERYVYSLTMGEEIVPQKYKNLPEAAAARCITDDIKNFIYLKNKA